MIPPTLPFSRATFAIAFALSMSSCGPAEAARTSVEASSLAQWEAHAREVFDDNIEATAVGLSMEGPTPRSDPFLRERAQTADVVSRIRVQTVTVDSVGDRTTYHLGVQLATTPFAKAKTTEQAFELVIRPMAPAFAIAKAFDARLQGRTFIAFLRRYRGEEGDSEIHFHLSADTPEVAAAVKEALFLKESSGS